MSWGKFTYGEPLERKSLHSIFFRSGSTLVSKYSPLKRDLSHMSYMKILAFLTGLLSIVMLYYTE